MNTDNLKPVIGMEIHVELKTKSKMFCGCPANHFAATPNSQTCPVCLGFPGALPVPNRQAIDWTIMIGLGLNSRIATKSKFDRKHYFYPDLPKGYQISQYDEPLCLEGKVETSFGPIRITRVHLEEDTAKLQHREIDGQKATLVDFNRSSVPLVEIVTEPDIKSAKQAREYAQKIHQLVRFLGVSDADMEKGSMRVEANISWGLDLGYKVEVKNINSFRFLEKAIDFELNRQQALLQQDIIPDQETRGWNESKNQTYTQRSKENANDYRYFPEPDIPPLIISQKQLRQIQSAMPPLPADYYHEFTTDFGVRPDFANILTTDKDRAILAQACFKFAKDQGADLNQIASYLVNKNPSLSDEPAKVIQAATTQRPASNLGTEALGILVAESIAANPDIVAKYRSGKPSVIGALVGDIMRRSKGQANPQIINQLLRQALDTKD